MHYIPSTKQCRKESDVRHGLRSPLWVYGLERKDWQVKDSLKSSVCLGRGPWEIGNTETIWSLLWKSFREGVTGAESTRKAMFTRSWERVFRAPGSNLLEGQGSCMSIIQQGWGGVPEGIVRGKGFAQKLGPHVEVLPWHSKIHTMFCLWWGASKGV